MSLNNRITKCRSSKAYYRGLIVRVIEDGIIFFLGIAAIWSLCHVVSGIFRILWVA